MRAEAARPRQPLVLPVGCRPRSRNQKNPLMATIVLAIFYSWLVERGDYETYEPSRARQRNCAKFVTARRFRERICEVPLRKTMS